MTDVTGDDFHVVDIQDPSNLVVVGSINLPTTAFSVAVQGRYAYVTSANTGDDFHVIDIIDPANPVLVDSLELGSDGKDVLVDGDYAYVVTSTPDELVSINISSPASISVVSTSTLSSDGAAVAKKGDALYVATAPTGDDFHIYDVSDPADMQLTSSLALPSGATGVTVAGVYVYVTTSGTGDDLHVIDISDSTAPAVVGSVELSAGSALDLVVVGRYAYVSSASTNDDFHVYDVSGVQAQSIYTQSLESGTVSVLGDFSAAGTAQFSLGLRAGDAGIQTDGVMLVQGAGDSIITGNLAIATSSPVSELTVGGTINASNLLGGATNLTTDASGNIIRDPSDVRLKTNVTTITGAIDSVMQLRGVRYEWKDKGRFGYQTEIGFIAQEVDLILPEVVRKGGDYWSINTRNILAVVVEAVKDVWLELQGTQQEVADLQQRLGELESQVSGQGNGGVDLSDETDTTSLVTTDQETETSDETEDGNVVTSSNDVETNSFLVETSTSTDQNTLIDIGNVSNEEIVDESGEVVFSTTTDSIAETNGFVDDAVTLSEEENEEEEVVDADSTYVGETTTESEMGFLGEATEQIVPLEPEKEIVVQEDVENVSEVVSDESVKE